MDQSRPEPRHSPVLGKLKFFARRLMIIPPLLLILSACGIEDYYFLPPVPSSNIKVESNSLATIVLPQINLGVYSYFNGFTIFYRIYVSDKLDVAPSSDTSDANLSSINSALSSDFLYFKPYVDSDTVVNTALSTQFRNRKYYSLTLENADINGVLDYSSRGQTISLDFQQNQPEGGSIPVLRIGDRYYSLFRSNGSGAGEQRFEPRPNRYFLNASELYDPQYINSNNNADVVDKTGITTTKYTYVSFYILVTGMDYSTYNYIYSAPAFVGILKLPDVGF